jgi:hypothetical protein
MDLGNDFDQIHNFIFPIPPILTDFMTLYWDSMMFNTEIFEISERKCDELG